MNIFRSRFLMVAGLAGAAGLMLNVNCGGGGEGGTGGSTGSGGTTSTGGKGGSSSGGNVGSGGSATGGSTATGGKGGSGTGGSATGGNGSGGSATGGGSGGSATGGGAGGAAGAGSGGSAGGGGGAKGGAGGSSNTDGGTQQYAAFAYTFDKNVQSWTLNNYNSGGNLLDVDGGPVPTLTWDSSVGSTGTTPSGSLKVDATYSNYSQYVQAVVNISPSVNASGKEVSVYVMLDAEDGGATWPGNVQVSANTAGNGYTQIIKSITAAGQWMQITLPLTASGSFDPTQLIQIGVEFTTYSKPEGGTFGATQHRTFHIDTVTDGSGLPPPPALNATFDSGLQGFGLFDSGDGFGDAGAAAATLTFDSTVGDPAAGSAKLVIPFTSYNQQLDTQINPGTGSPLDLTGKTIHAKVRLDSGTFTSGYINLHVSGPDYGHYEGATSGSVNASGLTAGQWVDLSIDLSAITATGFDASKIIQIGLQFGTGGGPEGGAFPTSTQPVTFHIDSIVSQ
jgi:hypothetical protein